MTRYRAGYYVRGSCVDECKKERLCDLLYVEEKDKKECIHVHSGVCWTV